MAASIWKRWKCLCARACIAPAQTPYRSCSANLNPNNARSPVAVEAPRTTRNSDPNRSSPSWGLSSSNVPISSAPSAITPPIPPTRPSIGAASNTTADTVTASTATPIIQQQIAGLVDGGTYTFYMWAKVASGTRKVSLAIVNNAYGAYLAGPTQITLTTAWQRFKLTGTLASGQTGLWIVVRQYDSNGDDWTTGAIYLWGACFAAG